jgi:hypothetical protein
MHQKVRFNDVVLTRDMTQHDGGALTPNQTREIINVHTKKRWIIL